MQRHLCGMDDRLISFRSCLDRCRLYLPDHDPRSGIGSVQRVCCRGNACRCPSCQLVWRASSSNGVPLTTTDSLNNQTREISQAEYESVKVRVDARVRRRHLLHEPSEEDVVVCR